LTGASLSTAAFEQMLPGFGNHLVTISLILFAFTTILGWSFYSEKCVQFLFGIRAITPYRWLWVLAIPIGAMAKLEFVWLVADTLNALMAIPNLIALLLLSPVIFRLTREYFAR
jgi:AGCS family alanine or glycine:cation symporter